MGKVLLAFLAFVAITSAQTGAPEPEGCEFCRAGVGIMFNHMAGDALDKVIQLLDDFVCPNVPVENFEGCKNGVKFWWPMLSNMDKKNGVVMFACKMSVLSPLLTVRNMAFQ